MQNTNELIVTKVIDAPRELAWSAWTVPELIARWFAPGIVMDVRELDVRPGGHFRFADPAEADGGEYTGTYITVLPLAELSFAVVDYSLSNDPAGVAAGFKVVFEEADGGTKMTLTSVPPEDSFDQQTFDAWTGCFERLAEVIRAS
jgi:uncharacterized protein YndB with AHSA1/START domain